VKITMDKKASTTVPFTMIILIFFIAAVSLATYISSSSKEEKVGTKAMTSVSLINNAENELVYLDSIARISAYESSQDLLSKFYNKECNKEGDYIILDSGCPADYNEIVKNFDLFFMENLKNHVEKAPYKFKDDYVLSSAFKKTLVVQGKANYKLRYEENNVFYEIAPNFKQELNLDLSFLSSIFKEVASKSNCLTSTSFNELVDSEDKLEKTCSFTNNFDWTIKKKDNLVFFDVKLPNKDISTKFAISLNTNSI